MRAPEPLDFFRVTDAYINFLRTIDRKIMVNSHGQNARVYIGILLTIGIHQYFAPLTSYKDGKHGRIKNSDPTCVIIYGKDRDDTADTKLALLNINNMFPVIQTEITKVDFDTEGRKYRALLEKEHRFIISNQNLILSRSKKLHLLITEKNVPHIKRICCDFEKLEQEYVKFNKKC